MTERDGKAAKGGGGTPTLPAPGQDSQAFPEIAQLLRVPAFVVLTENRTNPSEDGAFEAWAYAGPLDLHASAAMTFGVGHSIWESLDALEGQLAGYVARTASARSAQLPSERETAAILAALRYHQAENLQGKTAITDQAIREIATDGGRLEPLGAGEVDDLCERINAGLLAIPDKGLWVEAPREVPDTDPMFRAVYAIDLYASDPKEAAQRAHYYMSRPESMPPSLDVIDHTGHVVTVDLMDLPEEQQAAPDKLPVHPFVQRVHDLLYLEIDGDREFYCPDKSWDGADFLDMIAEELSAYIPRPQGDS